MRDYQTTAIVIPAAGVGRRMSTSTPKQFIRVGGKTILAHTVDKFHQWAKIYGHPIIIVIALSKGEQLPDDVQNAIACEGGEMRADSVYAAMTTLHKVLHCDWVMVHDAARPLVDPRDIENLYQTLKNEPIGGILAEKVTATVKRACNNKIIETIPREDLYLAQTPQMFRFKLLLNALSAERAHLTDEASAIEALGHQPKIVIGSADNIKITHPEDLVFFEQKIKSTTKTEHTVNKI